MKLQEKHLPEHEINQALLKVSPYLETPEALAHYEMEKLQRKNKSWKYIEAYLKKKNLPIPEYNASREIQKIQNLKQKHFPQEGLPHKKKVFQFFLSRGFEREQVQEVFPLIEDDYFERETLGL